MSALVKSRRSSPRYDYVSEGVAVRSQTWMGAAELANWIQGKGRQLIPACGINETIASGSSAIYRFRVMPTAQGLRRIWRVTATCVTGRMRSPAGSGTWVEFATPADATTLIPFVYIHNVSSGSAEADVSIEIEANGATSIQVYGVSLEEAPRSFLALNTTDDGVDINTEAAREPIYAVANKSLLGVSQVAADDANIRRSGLFHWAVNADTATAPSTTAGPTTIFPVNIPVLGPKKFNGDIVCTANWRVYVRSSGAGTTGTVRVTNTRTSTVTSILCTPGTTWTWYPTGSVSTFDIDCTDMNSADGRQTAGTPTFNDLTFDITRTGAAGTFYIAGISVWHV